MLEIISVLLFSCLFCKALGMSFRMAWNGTKCFVSLLLVIGVLVLIGCLLFAGGLLLLVPVAIIAIAFIILRACV